jgi:hypothetical protein
LLATNSQSIFDPDALNIDAWMNHRRQHAYDLSALQPAAAKRPAPPPNISSYFPGAEALEDQDLSELRAQQAKQHAGEEEVDRQNRWMLAPVFAPEAVLGALELGGLLGIRFLGSKIGSGASFSKWAADETGAIGPRVPRTPVASRASLSSAQGAVRGRARTVFARVNGAPAARLAKKGEVHHRIPIEYSDTFPRADPNRVSNLLGAQDIAHQVVNREWAAFERSLGGRQPTPAEVMQQAQRIDRMIEPYVLRRGLPRPPPKP